MRHIITIIILNALVLIEIVAANYPTCIKNNSYVSVDITYCLLEKTECENLKSATFLQDEIMCSSDFNTCTQITVNNSEIPTLDTTILINKSCNLLVFELINSKLATIANVAFSEVATIQELNLDFNKIDRLKFLAPLQVLKKLSLRYNNLTQISAQDFANCRDLRVLNFAHNRLTSIGNLPYNFEYLEEFYLNNNNITELNVNALESSSLKILDIGGNKIKFIASRTFSRVLRLSELRINNNQIANLEDDTFKPHDTFQFLDLSGNYMTEISQNLFSGFVNINNLNLSNCNISVIYNFKLKTIRNLDLSNNNLESIDNCGLLNVDSIQELYLSNNPFNFSYKQIVGKKDLKFLDLSGYKSEVLPTSFLTIELENFKLTNSNLRVIESRAFQSLTLKNTLDLSFNKIAELKDNAFTGLTNVQNLFLENNEIQNIPLNAFTNLVMCKICNSLISLNKNRLTVLTSAFKNIQNLKILLLSGNLLTTIEHDALLHLTNLLTLDLSYNNFSVIPPNAFKGLNHLEWLNLTNNKIFTLTATSFAGLNNLIILNLTNNLIEDFPLGTFQCFPSLKNLELGNNNFSKFKLGSFSNLDKLEFLNLSHNYFSVFDENVFYSLHNLRELDLSNNKLSLINYMSLKGLHLSSLLYITISNNNWNCRFLIDMLKGFDLLGITVLKYTERYTEKNIKGITCSDVEVDQSTTAFSTEFTVPPKNIMPTDRSREISTKDSNNTYALQIKNILSDLSINFSKSVDKLINTNKENTQRLSDLTLLKLINASLSIQSNTSNNFYKNLDNNTSGLISHQSEDKLVYETNNYTFAVYCILIIAIGIFCLLGFIIYKIYLSKEKVFSKTSLVSEIELTNNSL